MGAFEDRLQQLESELDALRKIKTQEDYDEGAILHAKHNAPWKNGQYSHLEFPPYVFQEFPKMLYSGDYETACLAYDQAGMIPARGTEEGARTAALIVAKRRKDVAMKVVLSAAEEAHWRARGWFVSPVAAVQAAKALEEDIATAAAHREYEDRNLSEQAKAEIAALEDASEAFVAEVPEKRRARAKVSV